MYRNGICTFHSSDDRKLAACARTDVDPINTVYIFSVILKHHDAYSLSVSAGRSEKTSKPLITPREREYLYAIRIDEGDPILNNIRDGHNIVVAYSVDGKQKLITLDKIQRDDFRMVFLYEKF
jgi:hypothetical protein